ncbi:hypothetical protein GCM10011521_18740 [Arenimonas soli]|uniref:Esterase n=1 Tax=Arenimonas soli TaxID=2269504 RepID=A0ABQ1HJL6_9GAMM|nr:alpha/beta hydrolase-fold protein [Arenimonas soli]GGA80680.1 hypothetical protein GCM10011521_18740 [Arenimonas soli]
MKRLTWIVWPLSLALAVIVTWFASLYVFERPRLGPQVQQRSLASQVLAESRDYLVHLPEGYETQPGKHYPVVYVLDGSSQDLHTAASAALMARIGVVPELIVVGIPNVGGPGRQRDYTPPGMRQDTDPDDLREGGGDVFLDFIERELVPAVDGEFRTTGHRTLAGNSRGGLLVVHALVSRPRLFGAFHAHSPALWRDDSAMVARLEDFLKANPTLESTLFLSLGEHENNKMKAAYQAAVQALERSAPVGLRWRAHQTAGAHHGNNAERATPLALQFSHAP